MGGNFGDYMILHELRSNKGSGNSGVCGSFCAVLLQERRLYL